MNSKISGARLLAAALGALVLAGCDSIKNVQEEPFTALPDETVVLGGQIKDLGSRRALVLQYNGADTCLVSETPNNPSGKKIISECRFFGVPDQEFSAFSFGALPVGTPYNITVKRQPFGRICTVQNPSGTVQQGAPAIQVTCAEDPAVTKYTVTTEIEPEANLPGLTVTLTTEYGTCPVAVNGRTSVTFSPSECPNSVVTGYHANATNIFNNGVNLPNTPWRVTATIPGPTSVSPPTNCFVTGGPVQNTGGNVNDNGEVDAANRPTGDVTTLVESCGFTVRAQADYSRPTGVVADPAIAPGDGITVALRTQPWGEDVAVARITSFANTYVPFMVPDVNGEPTATQYDAQSDLSAFYELVVKSSPAGMVCVPGSSVSTGSGANSTSRTAGNWTDAGAVLLRQPASNYIANLWLVDRVIRCRAALADANTQLRGSYWQYTLTTTTTTPGGGSPEVAPVTVRNRNVMTFFEDGQYLFGNHGSGAANNGVEQGFYEYNPGAQTLRFVAFTDTNGGSGLHTTATAGNPVPRTVTLVTREAGTPKRITARVSNGTVTGLVLAANQLTVTINNGQAFGVAATTYTAANFTSLINNINSTPGAPAGMAVANGGEITITGPPGGVVFGGSAAETLGLPTSVAAGATATSTNVASTLSKTVQTVVDWIFEEVGADPLVATTNPLDGAWVTWDAGRTPAPVEDRRRIFVYQHGLYNGMHIGVNGIANLQEACYVGNFGITGTWTRQGGRSGCHMRVYTLRGGETIQELIQLYPGNCGFPTGAPVLSSCALLSSGSADIPNATTVLKDYPGRWPQSQNPDFTDGRPYSLVEYEVRLANSEPSDPICPSLDKLTVYDTQHGTRKNLLNPPVPPIVLCRMTSN